LFRAVTGDRRKRLRLLVLFTDPLPCGVACVPPPVGLSADAIDPQAGALRPLLASLPRDDRLTFLSMQAAVRCRLAINGPKDAFRIDALR
jgi:hypothetical protein